jgi:hypothetical protein
MESADGQFFTEMGGIPIPSVLISEARAAATAETASVFLNPLQVISNLRVLRASA